MFKLPSHSLDVGTTYEFRVDATDSANYSSFATQVRYVHVAHRGTPHLVIRCHLPSKMPNVNKSNSPLLLKICVDDTKHEQVAC